MEAILATTAPSSVNEVFTGELNASNVVNSNPDIDSDIGIIDSDIGNNNNNNDTDTVGNDQESNSLINDMIDTNNEDNDDDDNPSSSSGMQSSVTSTSTTNPHHRQHKSELFQQILRHKQSWLKDQVQQHHHHCSAAVLAAASNHQNHFENVNKQLTSSTPGSNGSVTTNIVGNNQHQHSGNGSNGISSSDYYMGLALKQWSVYLGNVLLNFIHKECKPSIHHHGHQHNSLAHHEQQQHHNNHHHHHQIKCSNPQLVQCPAASRNNNILNAIQSNPAMNNSSLPQLQEQNHTSHHNSNNQLLHPHTTQNQINTNDPHPDANQPSLDQSAHNNNDNISNNNNNNNTNNVIVGNGCSGDDGENADNDDDDNNINGGGMHHAAAVGIGNGSLQQQHNQIQPQTPTTSSTDIEAANVNNGVISNGNVLNTAVIAASYCPCCRYHSSCNPTNNATNNINSFVPQSQTSSTLTTSATSCSSLSSNPFVMMSNPSQNTTPSLQQQQQNYYNSYAHFLQHRRYHVSSLLVVTSDINRIYSAIITYLAEKKYIYQ